MKIPYELAEKLDKFFEDAGYRSRAEIVNDAIRRLLDQRKRLDERDPEFEELQDNLQKKQVRVVAQ